MTGAWNLSSFVHRVERTLHWSVLISSLPAQEQKYGGWIRNLEQ